MKLQSLVIHANIIIPIKTQSIECDLILQVFAGLNDKEKIETKGKYFVDIDIADYMNVLYMGMPIKYDGFSKLRKSLSEFGIDIDNLITTEGKKHYDEKSIIELLLPQLESLIVV